MIVVVSDVHLGYEKCNKDDFRRFLETNSSRSIDHLVLLGDILDYWRRNNAEIVMENADILSKITKLNAKNIHYVIGNHDYYMLKLNERYAGNYPFVISRSLRLEDGGNKFYFIHGYELEVLATLEPLSIEEYEEFSEKMCFTEDVLGWIASHIWSLKEGAESVAKSIKKGAHQRKDIDKVKSLAVSEAVYILLGMKPGERLVFGHTHKPFQEGNIVNTGSWTSEFGKELQNSYVEISEGEMKLKFFK